MFRTSVILSVLLITVFCRSQEAEIHEFTDKKGQKIRAALLDVSADLRTMKIRREDGAEFDSAINLLSLDDQQFIKIWLANRPEFVDFRLEIAIDRKPLETERAASGSLQLETKSNQYEISVRNLSREPLESARLEYVVVWENGVSIYETDEGVTTYTTHGDETSSPMVRVEGGERLEPLAFNRETLVSSATFDIERVAYSEAEILYEDEPIGMVVRILTSSGIILAEEKTGDVRISNLSWTDAFALKEPRSYD